MCILGSFKNDIVVDSLVNPTDMPSVLLRWVLGINWPPNRRGPCTRGAYSLRVMLAWALGEAEAKASNGHDVMRGNALTGEKMGRKSETQGEPLDHASLTPS